MKRLKDNWDSLLLAGTLAILCAMLIGCGTNPNDATPLPSPSPSPSPTPVPLDYIVHVVALQNGNDVTGQAVFAGSPFKLSITGVTCVQSGEVVKCPLFGAHTWRQTNVPAGVCGDMGAVDTGVVVETCYEPTIPESAEFEGCVFDFNDTRLGCASVKVGIK